MFVAREERLLLAGERLEAERDAQVAANRAYEDYRENGRDTQGRRLGALYRTCWIDHEAKK